VKTHLHQHFLRDLPARLSTDCPRTVLLSSVFDQPDFNISCWRRW
jgi:hypothetical protein